LTHRVSRVTLDRVTRLICLPARAQWAGEGSRFDDTLTHELQLLANAHGRRTAFGITGLK